MGEHIVAQIGSGDGCLGDSDWRTLTMYYSKLLLSMKFRSYNTMNIPGTLSENFIKFSMTCAN